ncbi:MAG: DUF362 domain-containing protein [Deltaproteobacteria bacterium]|nr:DUF362 domain-containing protein [Deltaproteobacteria bacterium]
MSVQPVVSIVKCKDYDEGRVYGAVVEALEPLGGMNGFVSPEDRVLIKPNLLCDSPPERHVTTHPSVVTAVARLVKEAGGRPVIGDSPGLAPFHKAAKTAGFEEAAARAGAELAPFKNSVSVTLPPGATFKEIEVASEVVEADKVINLPKLKTHVQMSLTLGIKNMFGCVIGKRKSQWHLMAGKDRVYFARMIVDIFSAVTPALTIMDGVTAMHRDGPQNGEPYPMGLVFAANDAVALDAAITWMVGLTPDKNPVLAAAIDRGLGCGDMTDIWFPGIHPKDAQQKGFVIPGQTELEIGPGFLRPYLRRHLVPKPVTDHNRCTLCNKCKAVCPPGVITTANERIAINYDNCIHCFCCVEICPEGAMELHRSFLSKVVSKMQ